jgi:hypothetical protein
MYQNTGLPLDSIKAIFTEEVESLAGRVSNAFQDESRLFLRAILPDLREVAAQDQVQAGVALRAMDADVVVCPYVFRLVCTNGAIVAHAVDIQPIQQSAGQTDIEIETSLRTTIMHCCAPEIFTGAVDQMRLALHSEFDLALNLMPHLSRLPAEVASRVMTDALNRWTKSGDRSRFGLMNAVTALARDTADPEVRWTLETLGGRIGIPTASRIHPAHADHAHKPGLRQLERV